MTLVASIFINGAPKPISVVVSQLTARSRADVFLLGQCSIPMMSMTKPFGTGQHGVAVRSTSPLLVRTESVRDFGTLPFSLQNAPPQSTCQDTFQTLTQFRRHYLCDIKNTFAVMAVHIFTAVNGDSRDITSSNAILYLQQRPHCLGVYEYGRSIYDERSRTIS